MVLEVPPGGGGGLDFILGPALVLEEVSAFLRGLRGPSWHQTIIQKKKAEQAEGRTVSDSERVAL